MQHVNPTNDIVFETINEEFSWGRYGRIFKVIVHTPTGYINVSHLCSLATGKNGLKKKYAIWERNDHSQEFITETVADLNMSRAELIIHRKDVPVHLRGTYVHRQLVPHIAMWASAKFATYASKIIDEHTRREAAAEIAQERAARQAAEAGRASAEAIARDARIAEQTERVARQTAETQAATLAERMEQMQQQMQRLEASLLDSAAATRNQQTEIINQGAVLIEEVTELRIDNKELRTGNKELRTGIATIQQKLDIAVEHRVPPATKPEDRYTIYVYAQPRVPGSSLDLLKFTARCGSNLRKGVADLHSGGYTELVTKVDPTPNGMEIGKRFLAFLKTEMCKPNGSVASINGKAFILRVNATKPLTRADIAAKLRELDAKKRDV